jgi:hypothetical protein
LRRKTRQKTLTFRHLLAHRQRRLAQTLPVPRAKPPVPLPAMPPDRQKPRLKAPLAMPPAVLPVPPKLQLKALQAMPLVVQQVQPKPQSKAPLVTLLLVLLVPPQVQHPARPRVPLRPQ